ASVMVLVNDNAYGGCGGAFAVSYTGPLGPEVQTHEFGHSFGGLADEYDTGGPQTYFGFEPSQANVTADATGATKWPLWIGTQGVGLFEGALQYRKGIWRPTFSCLMRDLGAPQCAVCNEELVLECHTWVSGLDRVA